jgi:zinc D-Ala-D-Ala carboxypeptidase
VDRSHPLSPGYVPKDLVPLEDYGVPALGSEVLRREAAEHLGRLVKGATADGEELLVASAYPLLRGAAALPRKVDGHLRGKSR